MSYCIGQRWASHTETQLGLGIITQVDGRVIQISFPASGETRVYASDSAPLTRINYGVGDAVTNMDEEPFTIRQVNERDGLFIYDVEDEQGNESTLDEIDLSCFVQFTSPKQRLFNGQVDKNKAFNLRLKTLYLAQEQQQSPVKGLIGNRTELLAHQIYIANEVAKRHAPRVLLADEVGLGKTIEAGMILHYQLQSGQASRVLILVPDSLVHQWLVEMHRRFNLSFSIYSDERLADNIEAGFENPFDAEQLILCPLSLLTENPEHAEFAKESHWDMVIVDEAHHLFWSPDAPSIEYQVVEALAEYCEGLLLLTATPEQVGIEGHYARLRLLDPARFHSLESFQQEQASYTQINQWVSELQEHGASDALLKQFSSLIDTKGLGPGDEAQIIQQLLDRHGTGRVFFRNTRSAVKGFPQRIPHAYGLPFPDDYTRIDYGDEPISARLYPERKFGSDDWLQVDPRANWLVETLKSLKKEKVLVICHHASTALTLDHYLNQKVGIRSAAFYEGLSLIERDRAAAYFAEGSDDIEAWSMGAQVLICSEIGSEGRNFQFAHHLVLFDLPYNPDLLEQRIGRLDRIGQQHDIDIHIPYLENSAQAVLHSFYHQGMGIFERSCSVATAIFEQYVDTLNNTLLAPESALDQPEFNSLITDVNAQTEQKLAQMQKGRDRLIELNSCQPEKAQSLIDAIEDNENSDALESYMEEVFDHFAIESEYHSENCLIVSASDKTTIHLPGLKEEGNTVTFRRNKAVIREDMDFLSWEHPIVREAMELLYKNEAGNTALATISVKGLGQGALLVEAIYSINTVGDKHLQLHRYLPISPTRFLLTQQLKDVAPVLTHDKLSLLCKPLPGKIIPAVITQTKQTVIDILHHSDTLAAKATEELKQKALERLDGSLGEELNRLIALKAVNPSIRGDEIDFLKDKYQACQDHIKHTELSLNALRIVINQPK